ncbi:MAG: hypothetical protein K0R58_226 [Ramlibacter sp.]|jgi:hypothetical protein|nr:hypothetical protein [Ramlibacter sp.]
MTKTIVTWLLVAALAAAVVGGTMWAYELWRSSVFAEGETAGAGRIQNLWDEDRARAQEAAAEDARSKAAETLRRLNKQKENDDAQARRLAKVAIDLAGLRAAADGLQLTAATYLDAAGCGGRSGDPAVACVRAAVENALDVFGRCSSRVAQLAGAVDDARDRGQRCEAEHDALVLKP